MINADARPFPPTLPPAHTALAVIDMQRDFVGWAAQLPAVQGAFERAGGG